jgi:HTH-type transcriptional regulator/antitoxin HigA
MKLYQDISPFEATHPGSVLNDELEARGIKQNEAASALGIAATVLNDIVSGKQSMTADIAALLEGYLTIPADYWLRLQSQYERDSIRVNEKKAQNIITPIITQP